MKSNSRKSKSAWWVFHSRRGRTLLAVAPFLLAWLIYVLLGCRFVELAYAERLSPSVNALLAGRDVHSVSIYQHLFDVLFLKVFFAAIVCSTLLLCVLKFIMRRARSWRARVPRRAPYSRTRLLAGLACSAVTILLLFLIAYIRFRQFLPQMNGYREINSPDYVSPSFPVLKTDEILNLGWAHKSGDPTRSSYIQFSPDKKVGTVRIGLFGCSFVYGQETAPGDDMATRLQEHFKKQGYDNIEVINFGVPAYGMHQSYLMWKWVGQEYHLDHVVFFPQNFHDDRDNTFIFGQNYASPHARFLWRDDLPELRTVIGVNADEARDRYFSFVTPWQYFRYDAKAPVSLRALLGSPQRMTANPFYYLSGRERKAEMGQILAALFEDIAASSSLVVVASDPFVEKTCKAVASSSFSSYESIAFKTVGDDMLYHAPQGHMSAIGNELRAEELFHYLTGDSEAVISYVKLEHKDVERETESDLGNVALKDAYLSVDGKPALGVVRMTASQSSRAPLSMTNSGIRAFICYDKEENLFAPSVTQHDDGAEVYVSWLAANAANTNRQAVGHMHMCNRSLGSVELSSEMTASRDVELHTPGRLTHIYIKGQSAAPREVSVLSEGNLLLRGIRKPGNRFWSTLRRWVLFRPRKQLLYEYDLKPACIGDVSFRQTAGQSIDPESLSNDGAPVSLVLIPEDDRERVLSTCLRAVPVEIKVAFPQPYSYPIEKVDGGQ